MRDLINLFEATVRDGFITAVIPSDLRKLLSNKGDLRGVAVYDEIFLAPAHDTIHTSMRDGLGVPLDSADFGGDDTPGEGFNFYVAPTDAKASYNYDTEDHALTLNGRSDWVGVSAPEFTLNGVSIWVDCDKDVALENRQFARMVGQQPLSEAPNLPLSPKQQGQWRSMYGAFIVVMRPEDFLDLTTSSMKELQQIKDRQFPLSDDEYRERLGSGYEPGRFDMPFLIVEFPSGKIVGHEGRHRAAMVLRDGGRSFPCVVYPKEETVHNSIVTFTDQDGNEHHQEKEFNDHSEADWHGLRYFIGSNPSPDNMTYKDHKVETYRGDKLRGAPARSKPDEWKYAAWRKEDFPPRLIGQYNNYTIVTKFKVGLVKGYKHHRE